MLKDHSKQFNELTRLMKKLTKEIPSTMEAFEKLKTASTSEGELSSKTKELIALGIAITVRCDGCVVYHVESALTAGASSQEILETIEVAILMGGGPSVVYGCEALEALNQFIVLQKNG